MIKEYHGKRYYVELNFYQEAVNFQDNLSNEQALDDEIFNLKKLDDGRYVLYSDAKCGSFRGPKYRAWEKLKANLSRSRREQP